jgi:hypothetical protein
MKRLVPIVVSLLLLPVVSHGQDLYFTILDSLDYNPISLEVADFDGDGLDEIFAGSDTGLLVIDPRTHGILHYSDNLRERITASAFFDVDGDGAKDILVGTFSQGQRRFLILFGPNYQSWYQWGGYLNNIITKFYHGINPDTLNVILNCGGLYSINTETWDYTYGDVWPIYDSNDLGIMPYAGSRYTGDPYGYFIAEVGYYTSRVERQVVSEVCNFLWDSVRFYGFSVGNFVEGANRRGVFPFYCPESGMWLALLDRDGTLNIIPDTTNVQIGDGQYTIAGDINSDEIDELIIFMTVNGESVCRVYDGSNLQFMQTAPAESFGEFQKTGRFYDSHANFVYKRNDKIIIVSISTEPNSIDESVRTNAIQLLSAYPNPLNASTTVVFSMPRDGDVSLSVVNLLGQKVETIYEGVLAKGPHRFNWSPRGIGSGIYFIVALSPGFTTTCKVGFIK